MIWEVIPVALVTAVLSTLATLFLGERKIRRDYRLEFAAERVARELMLDKEWRLRSFDVIRHHLGGFDDDELRKTLVRAGAIRFTSSSGEELWGLVERNQDRWGVKKIAGDPETRPGGVDGPTAA